MSSFRDRILKYEQEPPSTAWQKISAALDESDELRTLGNKLYNTATPPPPFTWNKIRKELDQETAASATEEIYPPVRRMNQVWRYVAAAMFIGAIAYGIIRFATNPAAEQDEIAAQQTGNTEKNSDQKITDNNAGVATTPKQNQDIPSSGSSANSIEAQVKIAKSAVANAYKGSEAGIRNKPAINRPLAFAAAASERKPRTSYDEADATERYIVLKKTDGQYVRLSKKWGDMVCCLSGEEQDDPCKKQLEEWQKKLADADISASGNFMDLLNIVNDLD